MKRIYAIGESLVDIIFQGGQPKFAKAGGSMLNTTVSLGRITLPVILITEYGDDDPGEFIDSFLRENGVGTSYVHRFKEGKTALALAFLNEKNDARYTFYKHYPESRLAIDYPQIGSDDILLFGSIYSVTREIRPQLLRIISSATKNNALIVYDPNFRSSHAGELDAYRPMIVENLSNAGIVRGSDEDFRNIFGTSTAVETWDVVRKYCKCLIYTENSRGVSVFTGSYSGSLPVKEITPVSTIGAGDNFNAGLIASLYSMKASTRHLQDFREKEWSDIIGNAVEFASEVCMSYDNYIGLAFASRYLSASRLQM
jgi:fructokinase